MRPLTRTEGEKEGRIVCRSALDIPSAERLRQIVSEDRCLVLVLPGIPENESAKPGVIARLGAALPEFKVFDGGRRSFADRRPPLWLRWQLLRDREPTEATWITIVHLLPAETVLRNAAQIVAAARLFRSTAHGLMTRLAEYLNEPVGAFADPLIRLRLDPPDPRGRLDDEWQFWFHGFQCTFENTKTGQVLDVELGFPDEFGALDPWFFARFVRSTPELDDVSRVFRDNFDDPQRAIELLAERGFLVEVSGGLGRRGLTAAGDT